MNLDERAIKAAVRRAWGREAAPIHLRTSVERILRAGRRGGAVVLPGELGARLVGRHGDCTAGAASRHASAARFASAAVSGTSIGLPQPAVATLFGNGWNFLGAAACPVGPCRASHLLFARGDARLSLFALHASACPTIGHDARCDASVHGHAVAAFVADDTLYSIVGSAGANTPVDVPAVRQLRDVLHNEILAGRLGPSLTAPPAHLS